MGATCETAWREDRALDVHPDAGRGVQTSGRRDEGLPGASSGPGLRDLRETRLDRKPFAPAPGHRDACKQEHAAQLAEEGEAPP